jgi:type II secretory pathway pseudopilin PulG
MEKLLSAQKVIKNICAIKKASKRYLTLLELLIVFAIVAIAGGAMAFNVRIFYLKQQALSEMSRVVSLLSSAQELMMVAHLDSKVEFKVSLDGQVQASLVPASSTPHFLNAFIAKSVSSLKYIEKITFTDAFQDTTLVNSFTLWFASKGFLMNRGTLTMEGQGLTGNIILIGYPSALELVMGQKVPFPHVLDLRDELEAIGLQTAVETEP